MKVKGVICFSVWLWFLQAGFLHAQDSSLIFFLEQNWQDDLYHKSQVDTEITATPIGDEDLMLYIKVSSAKPLVIVIELLKHETGKRYEECVSYFRLIDISKDVYGEQKTRSIKSTSLGLGMTLTKGSYSLFIRKRKKLIYPVLQIKVE